MVQYFALAMSEGTRYLSTSLFQTGNRQVVPNSIGQPHWLPSSPHHSPFVEVDTVRSCAVFRTKADFEVLQVAPIVVSHPLVLISEDWQHAVDLVLHQSPHLLECLPSMVSESSFDYYSLMREFRANGSGDFFVIRLRWTWGGPTSSTTVTRPSSTSAKAAIALRTHILLQRASLMR